MADMQQNTELPKAAPGSSAHLMSRLAKLRAATPNQPQPETRERVEFDMPELSASAPEFTPAAPVAPQPVVPTQLQNTPTPPPAPAPVTPVPKPASPLAEINLTPNLPVQPEPATPPLERSEQVKSPVIEQTPRPVPTRTQPIPSKPPVAPIQPTPTPVTVAETPVPKPERHALRPFRIIKTGKIGVQNVYALQTALDERRSEKAA